MGDPKPEIGDHAVMWGPLAEADLNSTLGDSKRRLSDPKPRLRDLKAKLGDPKP